MKLGLLKGEVVGYLNAGYLKKERNFTRRLGPANVFVKIVIPVDGKFEVYSPYKEDDMMHLNEKFPDVYSMLIELKTLDAIAAGADGKFELKVPVSSWGYVVSAYVENDEYSHTDNKGSDGLGSRKPRTIFGDDIEKADGATIEGIIIPAEDKYWQVTKGTKKGDPATNPKTVPQGIMDDDMFERIEEFLDKNR